MLKTTKKLTLNKEKLRVLTDTSLDRVAGGWINTTGSDWCSSSAYLKCGGSCGYDANTVKSTGPSGTTQSQRCVNP